MANVPEHIHAFPRVNQNVVLPEAVGAWDSENKILYIGDGKTAGGVPFSAIPNGVKISNCYDNKIIVSSENAPFMIKTNKNNFYPIRGQDLTLSADENSFIIDISNALAANNMSEFEPDWIIYFAGKTTFENNEAKSTIIATNKQTFSCFVGEQKQLVLGAISTDGSEVNYIVSSGTLPNGISLSNGIISGTPTEKSTSHVTILASSSSASANIVVLFDIQEKNIIEATSPVNFNSEINVANYITLDATSSDGGEVNYIVSSGTLPNGITLSNGIISGIPTETIDSIVIITASSGTASTQIVVNFEIREKNILHVEKNKTFESYVGDKKSLSLNAYTEYGTSINYFLSSGTLPEGITLSEGMVSGTPEEPSTTTVKILVTSSDGLSDEITINFNIKELINCESNVYGIIYDPTNESPICKKIQVSNGKPKEVVEFSSMPAHDFKRCVMSDLSNRTINYYLDPSDSNKKEDGTSSILTGEDGDVMVEIPITYWKVETLSDGRIQYLISDKEFTGSEIHPLFYVSPNGNLARKQYIGAYQASLCDASGNPLDTDENSGVYSTYSEGYKARSIAGAKPWVYSIPETFSTGCKNNGGNLQNYLSKSYLFLMMAIEFGTLNTQSSVSYGFSYSTTYNYSYCRLSGRTNFGNGTGSIYPNSEIDSHIQWTSVNSGKQVIQFCYRGIENPFGQIFEMCAGIALSYSDIKTVTQDNVVTMQKRAIYSTKKTSCYSFTTYKDCYEKNYYKISSSDGLIKEINPYNFLVKTVLTTSETYSSYICDYYHIGGSPFYMHGGDCSYGDKSGAWCFDWGVSENTKKSSIGGRISA